MTTEKEKQDAKYEKLYLSWQKKAAKITEKETKSLLKLKKELDAKSDKIMYKYSKMHDREHAKYSAKIQRSATSFLKRQKK